MACLINAEAPIGVDFDLPLVPSKTESLNSVLGFNGIIARYCKLVDTVHVNADGITLWGKNKSKYLLVSDKVKVSNLIISDGWYVYGDNKYYIENGECKRGWLQLGKDWYHFSNKTATMDIGKIHDIDGKFYFLQPSGVAYRGWLNSKNERYYFGERYSNDKPSMKVGWAKIDDIWYYFDSNGVMQSDKEINGYQLNKHGKLIMA